MSGLKPVGSHMVKLILEFSQLAAALDTTRHHMSVNGVLMPANHGELPGEALSRGLVITESAGIIAIAFARSDIIISVALSFHS